MTRKRRKYLLKALFSIGLTIFIIFTLHSTDVYAQRPIIEIDGSKIEYMKAEHLKQQAPREFKGENLKFNNYGIPVLLYHSIGYENGNDLRVPKDKFKEQMKYLKDAGYTTLTLDELYNYFEFNKPVPQKSVVITFDDGYIDNYRNAYPVLKEYGFKAVVFVISNWVDKDHNNYMNSEELKELEANGIEIQCHTVNHDNLSVLPYEKQKQILKESKESLERMLNKKVSYLAYPFGRYNKNTLTAEKECGYKMAFTIIRDISDKTDGLLTLDRVFIGGNDTLARFISKFPAK